MSASVLVVDDDAAMCGMLERGLLTSGFETASATSADAALDLLHTRDFDAVVTDVRMRGGDGLKLCRRVNEDRPDLPVVVMTAFGTVETAIEAIRAGAYDFLPKPFEIDALRLVLQRAVRHRALCRKVERLEQALHEAQDFESLIGTSQAIRAAVDVVRRVAPNDAAVLITGESGTGKELVARALHRRSPRRDGPFVAVSCAALPEALLESELFGHRRGAFTDAREARDGLFLQASGGTLFLDEIGDLPLSLQPKLLRALQERSVRPVGGDREVPFDARIVTATNRDLEGAVADGTFREDLFYRVNVVQIAMPPLRIRGNDVLLLAQHFLDRHAAASGRPVARLLPAAAEKLLAYPWPGNVRELQNCMERAVALCSHSEVSVDDLPDRIVRHQPRQIVIDTDDPSCLVPMEEIERRYVLRVFESSGRNKSLTARILGFDRKTLYRKLRRFGAVSGPAQR